MQNHAENSIEPRLEAPMDIIPMLNEEANKANVRLRLDHDEHGVPQLFSVIDAIRILCSCDAREACQKYSNLPDYDKEGVDADHQFPGRGSYSTPVE